MWYWKTKCLSVLCTAGEAVLGRAPEICLSIIGLQIQNTPPHSRASRGPCERKKKNKPWLTQYSKITKSKQIEQNNFQRLNEVKASLIRVFREREKSEQQ